MSALSDQTDCPEIDVLLLRFESDFGIKRDHTEEAEQLLRVVRWGVRETWKADAYPNPSDVFEFLI